MRPKHEYYNISDLEKDGFGRNDIVKRACLRADKLSLDKNAYIKAVREFIKEEQDYVRDCYTHRVLYFSSKKAHDIVDNNFMLVVIAGPIWFLILLGLLEPIYAWIFGEYFTIDPFWTWPFVYGITALIMHYYGKRNDPFKKLHNDMVNEAISGLISSYQIDDLQSYIKIKKHN